MTKCGIDIRKNFTSNLNTLNDNKEMLKEFKTFGFVIDFYPSIDLGRLAIQDRLTSNNVVLISSGSLTLPDEKGGSII